MDTDTEFHVFYLHQILDIVMIFEQPHRYIMVLAQLLQSISLIPVSEVHSLQLSLLGKMLGFVVLPLLAYCRFMSLFGQLQFTLVIPPELLDLRSRLLLESLRLGVVVLFKEIEAVPVVFTQPIDLLTC